MSTPSCGTNPRAHNVCLSVHNLELEQMPVLMQLCNSGRNPKDFKIRAVLKQIMKLARKIHNCERHCMIQMGEILGFDHSSRHVLKKDMELFSNYFNNLNRLHNLSYITISNRLHGIAPFKLFMLFLRTSERRRHTS